MGCVAGIGRAEPEVSDAAHRSCLPMLLRNNTGDEPMARPLTVMMILQRVDCNDGVAAYVESLATGLVENGHRVVLVSGEVTTLYGSDSRRLRINAACLDWIVVDGRRPFRGGVASLHRVVSAIREHRVDVLSPQGFSSLPIASLAGRLTRRPVVMNFHLLQETISPLARLFYRAVPMLFPATRYIAMSKDIGRFFQERCGVRDRLIHNQFLGVDTGHFRLPDDGERARARQELGLRPGQLVALLPGRLNRSKGHDIATAAFRLLRGRRPEIDAICLFAGDGDERAAIEAETFRDAADRASFRVLGFLDRATMRQAYWAADIVLLPSRLEGFPLVVIEAMACGAVVIRTPGSGWQDQIVAGETGYVVPFDDPPALAAAIETVAVSGDTDRMRVAAADVAARRFSRSGMIAGTLQLYRDVVEDRDLP